MNARSVQTVEPKSTANTRRVAILIAAPESGSPRRAPPYGREVLAELAKGRMPNVYVFAGRDAWQRAERRRSAFGIGTALVAPANEDPSGMTWPILDAIFVDARGICRKDAVKLGAAIVGGGTRFAALLGPNDEPMTFRSES